LQNEATLVGLNINEDKTKYMQIKRTGTKDMTHLKFDNSGFEHVENFNYLGSILNADNKMNIEIAERIAKGKKAYHANAKLIKSKFLKRNTKMKIHKTIIRPVVTYSSEAWTLTAKDEKNLRTFERQILRKIFGPVNTDNIRRIQNNMEIDNLIKGADIVRFIKAQRIKRLGRIQRMDQVRPARKLLDWKPMGTRPVGRPKQRW
jgi:adenine-specific DNA methylase